MNRIIYYKDTSFLLLATDDQTDISTLKGADIQNN